MRAFIHSIAVVVVLFAGNAQTSQASEFVHIPGGEFRSAIPEAEGDNLVVVDDFLLQDAPVTNAEFLRFVLHRPEWRRGKAVQLFVDEEYLFEISTLGDTIRDGFNDRGDGAFVGVVATNLRCQSVRYNEASVRIIFWPDHDRVLRGVLLQAGIRGLD